jgi:hypothetical protein
MNAIGLTRQELAQGLIYAHNRANANTTELHEAWATLQALADLLVEAGLVDAAELARRRVAAGEALRQIYVQRGMAVAIQEFPVGKHRFAAGALIDCAGRRSLCRAACCRLPLALSREDVRQGVVEWEWAQPYMIAHRDDGYCVHCGAASLNCGIYEERPIPCRGYDCRHDARIWLDYDAGLINPRVNEPDWPHCLDAEAGA